VLFACAARSGELADNIPVARMLRALGRDERLAELPLCSLSQAETAELVRCLDAKIDAAAVFEESDGNPLFAITLAHGHGEGGHLAGRPLQAVIAGQFAALDEQCRSLLAWACAIGRGFAPGLLARLADCNSASLLAALETLERRGILRPVGPESYDFVHDLIRRAAYQDISQPRRKLMHAQIARVLDAMIASRDDLAAELVRHAEHAGDHALAARGCVAAGERSLRLFANADATALARRGRAHLGRLPDDCVRRELAIALLRIEVLAAAGPGMKPLPRIADELSSAVADAEEAGLSAVAATGHYLLSVLHQEIGATAQAQKSTVRAAEIGREADRQTLARQLANTARCLIELEVDIPRASALLAEAEGLLGTRGQAICELQWGKGLLARWMGWGEEAVTRIEGALNLARAAQDRWREYKCLTWLAILAYEGGEWVKAGRRCQELRAVAARLGESEAPLADAFDALSEMAGTRSRSAADLNVALSRLRAVDDKSHLAYALNAAAAQCLHFGQPDAATTYAQEALEAARAMSRDNEVLVAQAILVYGAHLSGHPRHRHRLSQLSGGGEAPRRAAGGLLDGALSGDCAHGVDILRGLSLDAGGCDGAAADCPRQHAGIRASQGLGDGLPHRPADHSRLAARACWSS
jgi:hypothetical protein